MPRFSNRVLSYIRTLTATVLGICVITVVAANAPSAFALPSSYLSSNTTAAGASATTLFTAGLSNGFTVGSSALVNNSGDNYVAWAWKKGSTPGFDIETYTGTGVAGTINHNLGAVPAMMIIKSTSLASNWMVYHKSVAIPQTEFLYLNSTGALQAPDSGHLNSTAPTSASFTVGNQTDTNQSGQSYIAYLWSEVPGFSKFGSYTGNGSADGPFVYTGFKPKFIMIKRTSGVGGWFILDTARNTYNPDGSILGPEGSYAEITSGWETDINSNGFKIRSVQSTNNTSADTYIYAAFADYPFERATTNQGYTIASSTRFNGTNATLNRTVTSGNGVFTISLWAKRSKLGTDQEIWSNRKAFAANSAFIFQTDDTLRIYLTNNVLSSTGIVNMITTQVFRDPSKWYHIVVSYNNATASLYVDGQQVTSFSTNTQGAGTKGPFESTNPLYIGDYGDFAGSYFNGYLSDVYMLDGIATTASAFGQTDSNGNWGPKSYTGTYGTNGFHLDFDDPTNPGKDVSGNGNNFTNNNIATTDNVADSPTNNFATLNPITATYPSQISYTNGNLLINKTSSTIDWRGFGTIGLPKTGKWFWEQTQVSGAPLTSNGGTFVAGIADTQYTTDGAGTYFNNGYFYGSQGGLKGQNAGAISTAYGSGFDTNGSVVGVAYDADAGTITFYNNGTSQGVAFSGIPITTNWYPIAYVNGTPTSGTFAYNFGQGGQSGLTYDSASGGYWKYAPPAGFKALSSANMISAGVSTIAKPSSYFGIALYTGNGTSQSITSYGFTPDFVWVKDRTSAQNHALYGDGTALYTNSVTGTLTLSVNTIVTGNANILGAVSKGSGTFMIDDPIDPKNKLLFHSFVESPDVLDTYDGKATLDADGNATIVLPDYFLPLNKDPKVFVSANSGSMPNLYVSSDVHRSLVTLGKTVFTVAGGVPGGTITWEVLGTRQDAFIRANPIIPVVEKTDKTAIKKGDCQFAPLCK